MRTVLTLDDDLAATLAREAERKGSSFEQEVDSTLRAGMKVVGTPPRARPYRLEPVHLGEVLPGFDVDKALRLSDDLEDEGRARKHAISK